MPYEHMCICEFKGIKVSVMKVLHARQLELHEEMVR